MILTATIVGSVNAFSPSHAFYTNGGWFVELYVSGVNELNSVVMPSNFQSGSANVLMYSSAGIGSSIPPARYLVVEKSTGIASWVGSYDSDLFKLFAQYFIDNATVGLYQLTSDSEPLPSPLDYLGYNNSYVIEVVEDTVAVTDSSLLFAVGYDSATDRYVPIYDGKVGLNTDISFVGFALQSTNWVFAGGVYTCEATLTGLIPFVSYIDDEFNVVIRPGDILYAKVLDTTLLLTNNASSVTQAISVARVYGYYRNSLGTIDTTRALIIPNTPFILGV